MVMSAIIHALLVDVVSEKDRAQAFFNMAVMTLIAELVTPAVGSILADWQGVYIPLLYAFPLQVASMAIFGLLPDTRLSKNLENDEDNCDPVEGGHSTEASDKTDFATWVKSIKESCAPFQTKAIWVVTVCYISTMLARDTIDFLVQYVSKRFDWSLAKVCIRCILFNLLLLIPDRQTTWSQSRRWSAWCFICCYCHFSVGPSQGSIPCHHQS